MSLIILDDTSLDCGYYICDVFDANTGIWWHYDDDKTTEISYFSEGVYTKDSHKNNTNKKVLSGSERLMLMVYFITHNLIESISVYGK